MFTSFNFGIDKIFAAKIWASKGLIKFVIRLITVIVIFFVSIKILLLNEIVQFVYDYLLSWCRCKFYVGSILRFNYIKFRESVKFGSIKRIEWNFFETFLTFFDGFYIIYYLQSYIYCGSIYYNMDRVTLGDGRLLI